MQENIDLLKVLNCAPRFSDVWHKILLGLYSNLATLPPEKCSLEEDRILLERLKEMRGKFQPDGWVAFIDTLKDGILSGWAKKTDSDSSQFISVSIDLHLYYESFLANDPRWDVKDSGFGTGLYGFNIAIDPSAFKRDFCIAGIHDPETMKLISFRFISFSCIN